MTGGPRIGVLALQGDVREHVRALEDSGAHARPVGSAAELDSVEALVIPGGESTTMSLLAVRDGLLEPLRAARTAGMPMYGSCAGMIMLADRVLDARPDQQTIGGLDVTVRRNAFGRQVDSFEANIEVDGIGDEAFPAVFIRAPWVEAVGESVRVLARVDLADGADTIVAVAQGPLLATSFHPELTGDLRIHEMFIGIVRQYS
ncbi:MAG: pyridoxal 5'-phosphate synthase glutaminase subunit PdxT [Actinomycetales bacterium]|nr:pyridoxal 5'-phosphate synthase glutaminase subunit PdxT [Actinomycetales bacterium]